MEFSRFAFGSYPQSKVTEPWLVRRLNAASGALPTKDDPAAWSVFEYGFFVRRKPSAWYIDLELDGERYRGVYFTKFRPYYCDKSAEEEGYIQGRNGYKRSHRYWFRYEPIVWQILSAGKGEGLLLSERILDSGPIYPRDTLKKIPRENGSYYANHYGTSEVRRWLYGTFLNTAFTEQEREKIVLSLVDNGQASGRPDAPNTDRSVEFLSPDVFLCEDTNDKVFLLSVREASAAAYGFEPDVTLVDPRLVKFTTDYARAVGAWTYTKDREYYGGGWWWLRTPSGQTACEMRFVEIASSLHYWEESVSTTAGGIVPAIRIRP